jgi:hypothetical protein
MKFQGFLFFIGLALLVAGTAAAPMAVSVDSATVGVGAKAEIPVKVSGALNLGAMDIVITYDPAVLQFSRADLGEISTNGIIEENSATPGTVKIGLVDTKGISGDGTLIKLQYNVIGKSGATTQVKPQVSGAWNLDLVDIQTTNSGGTISIGGAKSPLSSVTVLGALCVAGAFLYIRNRRKF